MKPRKFIKGFLIFSVILFTLMGIGLLVAAPYLSDVIAYRNNALSIAAGSRAEDFRSTQSSVMYDINGREITTISGAVELYYVDGYNIPDILKKAFVLIEDRKFYKHNGIDIAAVIRSGIANIMSSSIAQGASTITQQLARNIYLTQDVNWERKLTEMFLSMELEKKYSKEQILEFYINNIYYSNGYYGIEAAAKGYFDVSVNELTLSELVFLAAIPNNPSKYNPVTNMSKTLTRRDYILSLLRDFKYISEDDYYKAIGEEIVLTPGADTKCDYVETYVYNCATRALMAANGFNFRYEFKDEADEEAYNEMYDRYYSDYQRSLFTGGYRIYTSIDMDKQSLLQEVVNAGFKDQQEVNEDGVYKMQASAVCIDNASGFVTAIVGGRDQGMPGYTFNRAYQSFRQPGSSIKPLLVYAPFLQKGHNPDYIVDDSYMEGGPVNFEDRYPGESTVQEALAWSSNVVTWKLYEEITPEYGMSFLKKMNFRRIGDDEKYMAACLGGWTRGVSAVEMASAYCAMANDGIFREPTAVMWITDSRGKIIADNGISGININSRQIYEYNAARMINKILEYGVEKGLATGAQIENTAIAAKTGTTTSNKDGWIAGYSMYYTTVVWVGFDMPVSMPGLTGGTYPMDIWKAYMSRIHEGLPHKEFADYDRYKDYQMAENNEDQTEKESQSETAHRVWGDQDATGYAGDGNANMSGDKNASQGVRGDGTANGNISGDKTAGDNVEGDKTSNGNVTGDKNSTGSVQGDSSSSGNITGDKNAGGNAQGDSSSSGNVNGDRNAGGNAQGDSSSSGNVTGDRNAGGNMQGDSSSNGNVTGDRNAGGNAQGDSSSGGNITGDRNAGGNAQGDANSNGNISGDKNAGGVQGDSSSNGNVTGDRNAEGAQGDINANGNASGDRNASGVQGDSNYNGNASGDSDAAVHHGGDADAW